MDTNASVMTAITVARAGIGEGTEVLGWRCRIPWSRSLLLLDLYTTSYMLLLQ